MAVSRSLLSAGQHAVPGLRIGGGGGRGEASIPRQKPDCRLADVRRQSIDMLHTGHIGLYRGGIEPVRRCLIGNGDIADSTGIRCAVPLM